MRKYPRNEKDLIAIYNKQHKQAGDTEREFLNWAISYLLKTLNDLLNTEMNAHGETLEVILNRDE